MATGRISITHGGSVSCTSAGYIGNNSGATGAASVDGPGSTWTVGNYLYVNYGGDAALSITNGGQVINNYGYISGTSYDFTLPAIAHVDGLGSIWTNNKSLAVGAFRSGTLDITHGGTVSSQGGFVGGSNGAIGSSGIVNIDGVGSTWKNSNSLIIGDGSGSNGTVSVTHGGSLSSSGNSYVGFSPSATGNALISGAGSIWTNSGSLNLGAGTPTTGFIGSGSLALIGGGTATASNFSVNNSSMLAIDVGRNSLLSVGNGSGSLTNYGLICTFAGAGVASNGRFSPIAAGTWYNYGVLQALGGTWDPTGHVFTASGVQQGTSAGAVGIDLNLIQHILVNDNGPGGTGWSVGASFLAATSSQNISFTATAISGSALDALQTTTGNKPVLSGWEFSTTNYPVSEFNSVYLSFDVGVLSDPDDLQLWHYDGSRWTSFTADDLTYDGTYASFRATGFSGYAVTVPEPGTLALLLSTATGLVAYAWRRKSRR